MGLPRLTTNEAEQASRDQLLRIEARKKHREEYHQQALARLRNLKSKDPLRKLCQQLYDALIEYQVAEQTPPKDKFYKRFRKRAIIKAVNVEREAHKQGVFYARRLSKKERAGETP